ncbi:lysoplasmalogenase family protein [Microbacterium sp. BLY]|uniref:lysoplasmalogenase family protein n=1 Tax=Microbacterium sp. BLY TaxID=2823280 RepID=UPI001B329301|nr:lysoplasmalogenase family protein [Microbacterium sp. BLY]MBP3978844.1 lysoplasmalogenase [Microbacterium sp. BLY]
MQRSARPSVIVWAFVPYVAVSLVHVVLLALDHDLAGPSKLLLMPLLAVPVLVSARRIRPPVTAALLLIALLFSWLGDGAGALFPTAPELPLMLGFFGLAHVAYILLFARHLARRRLPWWTTVYAVWWLAMIVVLGPHTGGLLAAVGLYGLLLAGTAAFAARCDPLVAVGGAFFLASDTILAFRLFLPDALPAWSSPAVMLTYTLGQGLIVAGALLSLRRKAA